MLTYGFHTLLRREWRPQSEIKKTERPEPPRKALALWQIRPRFIRDLDRFNEWMNEEDYLSPTADPAGVLLTCADMC